MKSCITCKFLKPLEQFLFDKRLPNGRANLCKECKRAYDSEYRRINRARLLAYETTPKRVSSRRSRAREDLRKHRHLYPLKNRARQAVNNAIRRGKIQKRPCEMCGAEKVEAHHSDYSKPLEIQWLCHNHHRAAEGRLFDSLPHVEAGEFEDGWNAGRE